MRWNKLCVICCLAADLFSQTVSTLTRETRNPYGLVIGPDKALYICEIDRHVVSRLDLKTKRLTIVAGTPGKSGYAGDGGPATQALLFEPYEVRFDTAGNLFFVEMKNHLVRRVDKKTGVITTVAGTGQPGFSGDGGPAVKAQFRQPHSIAFDPQGRLVLCDIGNNRVRRIDLKSGQIETIAGNGEKLPTPNGAPFAPTTPLNGPRAIDFDPAGNLYLALREGNQLYRVADGRLSHLAGSGAKGYDPAPQPALTATLNGPKGVAWSPDGGLYFTDTESHTIRRVDLKTGTIQTVLGTGQRGDGQDGNALACATARPHGVYVDRQGKIYVGDSEANAVRLVTGVSTAKALRP
ncbi:MAG: SMP-30/gluconolactonase/LRE family protein [Bryobacteraceae bacterium]|nr:SMP-30/gluconolactonase/LRE family protein [Bryobacteraceae bacterium]